MFLKNIGMTIACHEQSNILYQKSLKHLLTSSNNSERIGKLEGGQESDISWKTYLHACMIFLLEDGQADMTIVTQSDENRLSWLIISSNHEIWWKDDMPAGEH